jgi:hypothetical protein
MAENDGSATTGNESNNDQGTNASDTSSGTSTSTAGSASGTTTGNGTLTQAQVDAIVRDRIAREREKYKGFDDLKRKAEQYDAQVAASQTDLEKAQTEAQKASERASTAEGRMKMALTRAAIVSEASKQGARDPSLLVKLIDTDTLEITDSGEVKGAAEAVTALLATHDYLKGNGFTGSGDGGQRTQGGVKTFTRTEIANPIYFREHKAEILAAQKDGRILDE